MRYKHLLSEQQLDEIRMSPGALRKFVASDEATGIRAGFEAELVFTGLGTDDDQEWEPDYDADERCHSIAGVVEFFQNDEWGYGMTDRETRRLEEGLDEMYYEWYDEKMRADFRDDAEDLIRDILLEETPMDQRIHFYLTDSLQMSDEEADAVIKAGAEAPRFTNSDAQKDYADENPEYKAYLEAADEAEQELEESVEFSLRREDEYWDEAIDKFRDNYQLDDDSGFFTDVGLRWMSDVANQFDLGWPVMTVTGSGEGSYDESNAENLARDLEEKLGVRAKVSRGYHSTERDDVTWIFEPDGSIDSDSSENMPVEIVSPPMPLKECLAKIEQFFTWAESNGAYSNSSTGFHMGVSLPHTGGNVDYLKLALFLGDEYILREFGRTAVHYTESALKKIRERIGVNEATTRNPDIAGAMELMRYNLIELAQKQLAINNHGFGKYTSINPQGGVDSTRPEKERPAKYIEFRSAGGTNYFEDIEKLQNTLMRYARAMTIAANPNAERREYYTKLYKLLTPRGEATGGVELFTEFATGKINKQELKRRWAKTALAKDAPELTKAGDWQLIDRQTRKAVPGGYSFNGFTADEARSRAKSRISPGASDKDFDLNYELVPFNSGKWEIYAYDPDFDEEETTLEIVDAPSSTKAAEEVYDKYNAEKIPFKVRPWYGDAQPRPEPKLTRRAQLAKRIKQPVRQLDYNYEIVNTSTGKIHGKAPGEILDKMYAQTPQEAEQLYSAWLKERGWPNDTQDIGYRAIQIPAQAGAAQPAGSVGEVPPNQRGPRTDYIFYLEDNPQGVFHRLENATAEQALEFIQQQEANGMPPGMLRVRTERRPTYESILDKEWELVVESMIRPVGRLGQ